ncbi:MAG: CocE/NonD family hydrolase, partial [Alistipes sp.]|nr:CocE/NonD family hydrolase [Alistipes sp.]
MQRNLYLSIVLLCISLTATAQWNDPDWFANNYRKEEYRIAMRDGVELYTAVYSPVDTTETHPILITRTPYGCAPNGKIMRKLWNRRL